MSCKQLYDDGNKAQARILRLENAVAEGQGKGKKQLPFLEPIKMPILAHHFFLNFIFNFW